MPPGTDHRHHLTRIARGGVLNLVGAAVSAVGGLALVAIVSRGFDPHLAGRFFAAMSGFLILQAIASLGADAGLARFVLRFEVTDRRADVLAVLQVARVPVLTVALLVTLVVELAAAPLVRVFGISGDDGIAVLRATAVFLPLAAWADISLAASRAFGLMRPTVVVDRILRTLLQAGAAALVAWGGGGLLALSASWAAAWAVTAVAGWWLLRRLVARRKLPPSDRARTPLVRREFWSFTWPRSIARILQAMLQRTDIVIVAALLSPSHAAAYTVATRFVPLGQFAANAIQQALQPQVSQLLAEERHDQAETVFTVSAAWAVLTTWPLYALVAAASGLYLTIFGTDYNTHEGRVVVVVMAGAMMVGALAGAVDTMLLMAGRSRTSLTNMAVGLAVDLVLCFVLIPIWGIAGAAAAWAASTVVRNVLGFIQVYRGLALYSLGGPTLRAVLANTGTLIVPLALVVIADGSTTARAVVAALGVAGYLTLLWLWREILHLDLVLDAVRRPRPAALGTENTSLGGTP